MGVRLDVLNFRLGNEIKFTNYYATEGNNGVNANMLSNGITQFNWQKNSYIDFIAIRL
jgi:hypothetical protein